MNELPSTAALMARLARGEPVTMLGVRHARTPEIARLAKASGHEVIWVDLEHSAMPIDAAGQICATALDIGLLPMVRVPEREIGVIGRLLDAGALGIIAPRIETAAQAAEVATACRFPPLGHRSAIATLPQVGYGKVSAPSLHDGSTPRRSCRSWSEAMPPIVTPTDRTACVARLRRIMEDPQQLISNCVARARPPGRC